LRLDPANAYVRLDLAAIYSGKGQLREAARLYTEAIKLKPNDAEIVEAYVNLGKMYYDSGASEAAIQLWRTALHMRPDLAFVRQWLSQAEQQRGQR
jgi:tetratricopeptide (TPR) repeat protein